ncbi:hypothetical protein PMAYCL1PPCAC_27136, partial [Pristionchus mayeri]
MTSEIETAHIFASSLYLKSLIAFRLLSSGTGLICMTILELNIRQDTIKKLFNQENRHSQIASNSTQFSWILDLSSLLLNIRRK